MDPRLRAAVDASRCWYDDVFAAHGIRTATEDGVWWATAEPPRWHSAAKSTEPHGAAARALRAVGSFEHCSIADSFGSWDLSAGGFDLLFEATWLHRAPAGTTGGAMPSGWSLVLDEQTLGEWNDAHDTTGVLLPRLLTEPRFTFLAHHADGVLTGGAVLHDGGEGATGLWNYWNRPGTAADAEVLLGCVDALRPGRGIVTYARGDDLDRLVELGFAPLGPQVVWLR